MPRLLMEYASGKKSFVRHPLPVLICILRPGHDRRAGQFWAPSTHLIPIINCHWIYGKHLTYLVINQQVHTSNVPLIWQSTQQAWRLWPFLPSWAWMKLLHYSRFGWRTRHFIHVSVSICCRYSDLLIYTMGSSGIWWDVPIQVQRIKWKCEEFCMEGLVIYPRNLISCWLMNPTSHTLSIGDCFLKCWGSIRGFNP